MRLPLHTAVFTLFLITAALCSADDPKTFVRFRHEGTTAWGLVKGDMVHRIHGSIYGDWSESDARMPLSSVTILTPTEPTQVFAMAGNYRSHLNEGPIPEKFRTPQPFLKTTSCLIPHGAPIVLPADSSQVHYEAEMVVVIGRVCRDVSEEDALEYVLGVTAGNDVSERVWQNDADRKDVQWWRAKGSDTFGPVGPYLLTGIDYDDLRLRLVLNGETKQEESTSRLIHDVASTVSFISQYVTLHPGDLIFTGTPGRTGALHDGDTVEVHLNDMILSNPVRSE